MSTQVPAKSGGRGFQSESPCSREDISALLDGELAPAQIERLVTQLLADDALCREWELMNAVGDCLRSSEVGACHSEGFVTRVAQRLAAEPTVLAPRRSAIGVIRRVWMPGLAVAASVAVLGFVAVPLLRSPQDRATDQQVASRTAAAPEVLAVSSPPIAAPSAFGARMEGYLAAHRELSDGYAMTRSAAYLRTSATESR